MIKHCETQAAPIDINDVSDIEGTTNSAPLRVIGHRKILISKDYYETLILINQIHLEAPDLQDQFQTTGITFDRAEVELLNELQPKLN